MGGKDEPVLGFPSIQPKNTGKNAKAKDKKKSGGFQSMDLDKNLLHTITKNLKWGVPTPIQRNALPAILSGQDAVVKARTGAGKTGAFCIPLVNRLKHHSIEQGARALVLSPTRDLAIQTFNVIKKLVKGKTGSDGKSLRLALFVGGISMTDNFKALSSNPDVIIGAPGRIRHLLDEVNDFNLEKIEYLVFDEADRLYDPNFIEDINEIMKTMPAYRQTVLVSATMPESLKRFVRADMRDPFVTRLMDDEMLSENLKVGHFVVNTAQKIPSMMYFIKNVIPYNEMTIIFVSTQHHVEMITALMIKNNLTVSKIHGHMDQQAREMNLKQFRRGETKFMVVTDVAARGIDIPLLNNVINFDFPGTPKLFIHRVGRAARQGREGAAFSFVTPNEVPFLLDLTQFLGDKIKTSEEKYSLKTMTTENVHFGNFPNIILEDEIQDFKAALESDFDFENLHKSAENAFHLYSRTRGAPSSVAVEKSKEMDLNVIHPLLRNEMTEVHAARDEMLALLRGHRADHTVFEILAAKNGKVSEQAEMMKKKRRRDDVKIAKAEAQARMDGKMAKGMTSSKISQEQADMWLKHRMEAEGLRPKEDDKITEGNSDKNNNDDDDGDDQQKIESGVVAKPIIQVPVKRRLSKAERKKLKNRRPTSGGDDDDISAPPLKKSKFEQQTEQENESKRSHFISAVPRNYAKEKRLLEDDDGISARSLDNGMIGGDGNNTDINDPNEKKRIMYWDKKKKNFVKIDAKEVRYGRRVAQKMPDRNKPKPGVLYEKWKQKSNQKMSNAAGYEVDNSNIPTRDVSTNNNMVKNAKAELTKTKKQMVEEKRRKLKQQANRNKNLGKRTKKAPWDPSKGKGVGVKGAARTRSKAIIRTTGKKRR
eukprot:TRINITY_DN36_c6_g1_i1.p1 TRINITY_DN36_c6_g1~~TRINITY_DN36_c6_g1_i1.p1  ORF type:complete len:887 (-),score=317.66 TRINITY_DN36_c6_g1_i1:175-2805(-)